MLIGSLRHQLPPPKPVQSHQSAVETPPEPL